MGRGAARSRAGDYHRARAQGGEGPPGGDRGRVAKSLANTEVALQKSLETLESEQSILVSEWNALELARKALESEQKARSEADQEVLALLGWVMGMEEANARLCALATRQAEEFSILENFRVGTYLFYFLSCWFLPSAYF